MANAPVRFPSGLNVATKNRAHQLYNFKSPVVDRSLVLCNSDFTEYRAVDWTVFGVGTPAVATSAALGGVITLTTTATSGDSCGIQHNSADLSVTAGSQFWFECRMKADVVSTSDVVVGIQVVNTTPLATTDGIYFVKPTGAAVTNFIVEASSTSTTVATVDTMVANTYVKYAFYYDGKQNSPTLYYYVNDVLTGTAAVTNIPVTATLLAPVFYIKTNSAAARVMSVDYYLAATEITR